MNLLSCFERNLFSDTPRMIFFHLVGNNLFPEKTLGHRFEDFMVLVARVRAKLPEMEIIFLQQNLAVAWRPPPVARKGSVRAGVRFSPAPTACLLSRRGCWGVGVGWAAGFRSFCDG